MKVYQFLRFGLLDYVIILSWHVFVDEKLQRGDWSRTSKYFSMTLCKAVGYVNTWL
jgi:hypothetical protein